MLSMRNPKKEPAILNTRLIGARNSYEFKSWLHRRVSDQLTGYSLQTILLVLIVIWLGLLGTRAWKAAQGGTNSLSSPSSAWMVLLLAVIVAVLAIWRLVCNFKQINELRREVNRVSAEVEHVPGPH
jgi:hypothetical protein